MDKQLKFDDLVFVYDAYGKILDIERFIYKRPDNQKYITEQIEFNLVNDKIISCCDFGCANYHEYSKVEKITLENINKINDININNLYKQIEENTKEKENIEENKKLIYNKIYRLKNDIERLKNIENKTENQIREIKRLQKAVRRNYKRIKRLTIDVYYIDKAIRKYKQSITNEEKKMDIIKEYVSNRKEMGE